MRSGNQNTTYGIIDNLALNYRGNQLIKVEDTASDSNLSVSSMDFRNGAKQDVEYFYDENGNLIKDLNKGIADIQYNLLNLPRRITFNDTNKSTHEYVYSADGKKLYWWMVATLKMAFTISICRTIWVIIVWWLNRTGQ